ncbi:MAG TPA: SDR family oxidoreductase [Burkholderiales bacterium]|nr:SDR family oxidoreductase [Burkholderiales bacterium]
MSELKENRGEAAIGDDRGLSGKVAIVTGASTPRGIGNEIAKRFARGGASLLLVAEATQEQLDSTAKVCRELGAERVEVLLSDLGETGAAERMVEHAEKTFGRVDVLVNNAGIRDHIRFGEFTREIFDRIVAVNLAAPFFASQAVLTIMRRQGGGRIIHTASQLGHVAYDKRAVYGLTKAAIIHLTKSMAYELGRDNIIVNAISPGPVATGPILSRPAEVTQKRVEQYVPAGRVGEPEEIADLAYFLATTAPAFMQGTDIVIDGGYIIH